MGRRRGMILWWVWRYAEYTLYSCSPTFTSLSKQGRGRGGELAWMTLLSTERVPATRNTSCSSINDLSKEIKLGFQGWISRIIFITWWTFRKNIWQNNVKVFCFMLWAEEVNWSVGNFKKICKKGNFAVGNFKKSAKKIILQLANDVASIWRGLKMSPSTKSDRFNGGQKHSKFQQKNSTSCPCKDLHNGTQSQPRNNSTFNIFISW